MLKFIGKCVYFMMVVNSKIQLFSLLSIYSCSSCVPFMTAMYVNDVQEGTTSSIGDPVIEKETVSTALIDAKNILGPVSLCEIKYT